METGVPISYRRFVECTVNTQIKHIPIMGKQTNQTPLFIKTVTYWNSLAIHIQDVALL